MLSRFLRTTLLFLLFFDFGAHSTTVDLHRVNYVKHRSSHQTVSSTVSDRKSGNSVLDMLLNQGSAAHITSQNYKPAQFTKVALLFTQHAFASLVASKYTSGRSATSFSLFREQILYPFHGFW